MPYISLSRTTADCYYMSMARTEEALAFKDVRAECEYAQRLLCSDGDASVSLAETSRALEEENGEEPSLHSGCTSHEAAGDREKVGDLRKDSASKLTSCILALRQGNFMKLLRTVFKIVFIKNAKPLGRQVPSTAVRIRNLNTLDFYLPSNKENEVGLQMIVVRCRGYGLSFTSCVTWPWWES